MLLNISLLCIILPTTIGLNAHNTCIYVRIGCVRFAVFLKTQCKEVVDIGASCYNFQLKSPFVKKSMLYALFMSTYTFNLC